MWQVVCVVRSYEEKYEHAMEGEVFETEAEADARAEAERKLEAKRAALAKLTQEEKQLLGLY